MIPTRMGWYQVDIYLKHQVERGRYQVDINPDRIGLISTQMRLRRSMAGKIADGKKRISLVLDETQLKRLDARAAEAGTSRAALMSQAVDAYLDGDAQGDIASAKLETIIAKLDSIKSGQDALKSEQKAQGAILAAKIDAQPISVQLPAAESPQAEPEAKKGVFARLFIRS